MRKTLYSLFVLVAFLVMPTAQFNIESKAKRLAIGDFVPEIKLPNLKDTPLKVSDLRGEIVLVNFWSTWCVACNVIKNPEYVRLYNKYKDYAYDGATGFSMYSVAFDSDKAKWKSRIVEQGMSWPHHVVDTKSYRSPYWEKFGIRSIPSSFLIDAKGRIIGINLSEKQISQKLNRLKRGKRTAPIFKPGGHPIVVAPPPPPPPPPTPKPKRISPAPAPAPAPTPAPVVTKRTVYKIQLGIFRAPNLNKFNHLNGLGNVHTEQVSSRLQRVLLGTFDRRTAYNMLMSVRQRGYRDAFVVRRTISAAPSPSPTPTPQPTPPPVTDTRPAPKPSPTPTTPQVRKVYKIQLGVFRKAYFSRFSRISHLGTLSKERTSSGLERVLLGNYTSRSEASTALYKVQGRGYRDAFLVRRQAATPLVAAADLEQQERPDFMNVVERPPLQKSMKNRVAPDLLLPNMDGEKLPLSTFEGKVSIINFWASWMNVPEKNKELEELYKKYKDKGLAIYNIGFDEESKRWLDAIKENGMDEWSANVIDERAMDSPILKTFGVEYLPVTIVVDKNRKVIAEAVTGKQLQRLIRRALKK